MIPDNGLYTNIMDVLMERFTAFNVRHGQMPDGFVLGPVEYLSLVTKLNTIGSIVNKELLVTLDNKDLKLYGVPVYVKAAPGIDVIIPAKLIPYFSIGLMK
jgi:hypothetical protein